MSFEWKDPSPSMRSSLDGVCLSGLIQSIILLHNSFQCACAPASEAKKEFLFFLVFLPNQGTAALWQ